MKKIICISIIFTLFNSAYGQWTQQHSILNVTLSDIDFYGVSTGFACGNVNGGNGIRIYKTTNSGSNWVTNYILSTTAYVSAISSYGFCAFSNKLLRSTNMGESWTIIEFPSTNLQDLSFYDVNTGYISGGVSTHGLIIKTTNRGATFTSYPIEKALSLSAVSVCQVDPNRVIACEYNGYISRTTNGGISWLTYNHPLSGFDDIAYIGNNTIFICGIGGLILKSEDGGSGWVQKPTNISTRLFCIEMVTPTIGYACGLNGVVLKTFNGGNNWYVLNTGTVNDLMDLTTADVNRIHACGEAGTIIGTTNGGGDPIGIEPISSEIPDKFSLSQNYPNPFNPTTNIEFNIAKSSYVKIIVYDILGNEMAVLENDYLKAGRYKTSWNAANATSGTYFYKIIAGEFTDTKKMVLIK